VVAVRVLRVWELYRYQDDLGYGELWSRSIPVAKAGLVMYALMVEPGSDRLRFFACKPRADGAAPVIRELETPAIVDGPLHVKARTFAGYPIAWSFAMIDDRPPHDRPL